jgi:hypothetical protein
MVARKTVCLRRLGGNRRGELQAGRFFANPKVTAAKIVEGWGDLTGAAVAGLHVLAIQACPCEVAQRSAPHRFGRKCSGCLIGCGVGPDPAL